LTMKASYGAGAGHTGRRHLELHADWPNHFAIRAHPPLSETVQQDYETTARGLSGPYAPHESPRTAEKRDMVFGRLRPPEPRSLLITANQEPNRAQAA
jgi:hypothetical protein